VAPLTWLLEQYFRPVSADPRYRANLSLRHATLGTAAAHLSYLYPVSTNPNEHCRNKLAAAYHWQKALQLFRNVISKPSSIGLHNMDALISTCMLITIHSFYAPDPDPYKSFVYTPRPQRLSTLKWLTVHSGFRLLVEQLANHISRSIWFPVMSEAGPRPMAIMDPPSNSHIITTFISLCDISSTSTVDTNPYLAALAHLLPYFPLRACLPMQTSFNQLVAFMGRLSPTMHDLIVALDPAALLIFAYWLALMTHLDQWWITGRATSECMAIVTYLMHNPDEKIQSLLEYPATVVGITWPTGCETTAASDEELR